MVSLFGPGEGYAKEQGESLLEGFVNSLAPGATSTPPTEKLGMTLDERISQNAEAFLFVLEFSLGSPLSLADEQAILEELKQSWSQYPERS